MEGDLYLVVMKIQYEPKQTLLPSEKELMGVTKSRKVSQVLVIPERTVVCPKV